jgi:N-acetyl sugar amidotransferase
MAMTTAAAFAESRPGTSVGVPGLGAVLPAAADAYRMCARCVMDTSDPDISFDANGVCSHCHRYDAVMGVATLAPGDRTRRLEQTIDTLQRAGKGRPYDCVIGVSGGVDSTYVALLVKRFGLRCLAVHVDNGWNTEIAVRNVERALRALRMDLHTVVLDWDAFRDVQLAFLRASTPDAEIPSDHAIAASVHHVAWELGVPYLVMGFNLATELILPKAWSQGHMDWVYISSVHRAFGSGAKDPFPHFHGLSYLRYRYWAKYRVVNILELVDYSRDGAAAEISRELGWTEYGGKHYESLYTRFFQGWILPRKFGFDKRRAHLSNQVLSGRKTREAALAALEKDPYPSAALAEYDRAYVFRKLEISESEFDRILALPPRRYQDYPNMANAPGYRTVGPAYNRLKDAARRVTWGVRARMR